ncbi:MAG: molybdopterin-dependent oxidoreductase [Salinigranum sp.]
MNELEVHDVPDAVEPEGWRLVVDGRVDRRVVLTPDELRSMALVTVAGEFSCVEGWTAPDLTWRGVGIADLLARARPGRDAEFALVRAMDGEYACGFPIDRLSEALLAIELDGEALPVEHGGPARLVPADESDCWESVKWVARIELRADRPDDTARDLALSRIE